jgi:hypothetical protein
MSRPKNRPLAEALSLYCCHSLSVRKSEEEEEEEKAKTAPSPPPPEGRTAK